MPPRLRAAALHDLALAGLPDCALPTLLASSVWLLHDGSAAASYRWAHFAVSSVFDLPSGLEFTIEQLIGSDNDMDWSDCPPCHSNAYALTGNDLSIRPLGKFDYNSGLWSGPWPGPWLLLSSYGDDLGEVWERSHYAEDDAEVFAILEQVAASVWVHAPGTHEGEWTWP